MSRGASGVSERVLEAVADYEDVDELELPPLYDSIDPDALDALIGSMGDGQVTFTYADQRITVDSRGAIHVEECSPPRDCEV